VPRRARRSKRARGRPGDRQQRSPRRQLDPAQPQLALWSCDRSALT
jgi:hypothetical protein